nr:hypothetical protein [Desulfovibrio ferrophilus]
MGCGWCCLTDQCNVSHDLYGYSQPCPDLYWDEALGRYVCLLMRDDEKREQYRKALYQGEGCCARFNPWRENVRNRDGER